MGMRAPPVVVTRIVQSQTRMSLPSNLKAPTTNAYAAYHSATAKRIYVPSRPSVRSIDHHQQPDTSPHCSSCSAVGWFACILLYRSSCPFVNKTKLNHFLVVPSWLIALLSCFGNKFIPNIILHIIQISGTSVCAVATDSARFFSIRFRFSSSVSMCPIAAVSSRISE